MGSVDSKDFSCNGLFLRHPFLISNALTVVSAIQFRPYRFSSSSETGIHLNEIHMNFASVFDASAGKHLATLFKQVAHKLISQAAKRQSQAA
jgi:hypothetical protein